MLLCNRVNYFENRNNSERGLKMKKILIFLISVCLLFCGCAGGNQGGTQSPDDNQGGSDNQPAGNAEISIVENDYSLGVGITKMLEIEYKNVKTPTFESDNSDVVSVSPNGEISGKATGKAKITVRADSSVKEGEEVKAEINVSVNPSGYNTLKGDETAVKWLGRTFYYANAVNCYNTASGFEIIFYGTKVSAVFVSAGNKTPQICVMVDGKPSSSGRIIDLAKTKSEKEYVLAEGLTYGRHTLRVCKITEAYTSSMGVKSISTDGYLSDNFKTKIKTEFYGDSITTGHNNIRKSDAEEPESTDKVQNGCLTYAYLAAQSLNADISVSARVGIGLYSAWGNNFILKNNYKKTYLAEYDFLYGGINPQWDFKKYVPDFVIINIGTNDVWYDWKKDEYEKDLKKFVEDIFVLYGENTKIVLAGGMMVTDNLPICNSIAKSYKNVYTLQLPSSTAGHPRIDDNKRAAVVLANYIKKLIAKNQ